MPFRGGYIRQAGTLLSYGFRHGDDNDEQLIIAAMPAINVK
jgi:hypothetical protein